MSNNLLKGEAKEYNKNLHPSKTNECPPKNRPCKKSCNHYFSGEKIIVFRGVGSLHQDYDPLTYVPGSINSLYWDGHPTFNSESLS